MSLARLRDFVRRFAILLEQGGGEEAALRGGRRLLTDLITHDDWLPDAYAQPSPERYRQYLLHCDSAERFSVVSFVWGPGQSTPIHNHTVWGLVGVLRGSELSERFEHAVPGGVLIRGLEERLEAGQVDAVSPRIGDIHKVSNAFDDRVSISIHVYGANIGAVERSTFDEGGRAKPFISGYANTSLPNLWDLSALAATADPIAESPAR